MSNVRGLFSRRDSASPVDSSTDAGEAGPAGEVVLTPPQRHLQWLLMEVEKDFAQGEWMRAQENFSHAVYVAATKGLQGMPEHELIHRLRRISGFGFDPGEAA